MSLINGMDEIIDKIKQQESIIKELQNEIKVKGEKIQEFFELREQINKSIEEKCQVKVKSIEDKFAEHVEWSRDQFRCYNNDTEQFRKENDRLRANQDKLKTWLTNNNDNLNFKIGKELYDILYMRR
jgi:hypothetical protein